MLMLRTVWQTKHENTRHRCDTRMRRCFLGRFFLSFFVCCCSLAHFTPSPCTLQTHRNGATSLPYRYCGDNHKILPVIVTLCAVCVCVWMPASTCTRQIAHHLPHFDRNATSFVLFLCAAVSFVGTYTQFTVLSSRKNRNTCAHTQNKDARRGRTKNAKNCTKKKRRGVCVCELARHSAIDLL